jgi:Na+/proline symporter
MEWVRIDARDLQQLDEIVRRSTGRGLKERRRALRLRSGLWGLFWLLLAAAAGWLAALHFNLVPIPQLFS